MSRRSRSGESRQSEGSTGPHRLLLAQAHNPGTQDAHAQTVEKGETATAVRRQHWAPGEGECDDGL